MITDIQSARLAAAEERAARAEAELGAVRAAMIQLADAHDRLKARLTVAPCAVYTLFAQGRLGPDNDFLAVYSTRDRAQRFIDAQDERLREVLFIVETEVDQHTREAYWRQP